MFVLSFAYRNGNETAVNSIQRDKLGLYVKQKPFFRVSLFELDDVNAKCPF